MLATSGDREVIAPTARRVASHFGETVHVAAWERGHVLYVDSERRRAAWSPRASRLQRA